MQELSISEIEVVNGGSAAIILAGIGLGVAIIVNSGALGDFFSGVFDGIGDA